MAQVQIKTATSDNAATLEVELNGVSQGVAGPSIICRMADNRVDQWVEDLLSKDDTGIVGITAHMDSGEVKAYSHPKMIAAQIDAERLVDNVVFAACWGDAARNLDQWNKSGHRSFAAYVQAKAPEEAVEA